jgi:hypothetical protein
MRQITIAAALACACAFGQTQDHGRIFLGPLNAGGATITIPAKITTSDPGTCSVGEAIFRSDLSAGANIKFCTSTNTWTAWSGSGSYTAGAGISIAGNEISVDPTNIVEKDADSTITGANTFSGRVIGAMKIVDHTYVNTTITPNVQNSTGGAWTQASPQARAWTTPLKWNTGDVIIHEALWSKPTGNTNAMYCTLFQGSTNLIHATTQGYNIGNTTSGMTLRVHQIITGASSQTQFANGNNMSASGIAVPVISTSVSNATPTYEWRCTNQSGADVDDAATLLTWTIYRMEPH